MSRTGRPRKTRLTTKGEPVRNIRPARDRGTIEAQLKRRSLAANDPTLSASPLGVLLVNSIITQDQFNSALLFSYLHGRVFGACAPPSGMRALVGGQWGRWLQCIESAGDVKCEATYHKIKGEFLRQAPQRRVVDVVERLVIYEEWPPWCAVKRVHPRISHVDHANMLVSGLRLLNTITLGVRQGGRKSLIKVG